MRGLLTETSAAGAGADVLVRRPMTALDHLRQRTWLAMVGVERGCLLMSFDRIVRAVIVKPKGDPR